MKTPEVVSDPINDGGSAFPWQVVVNPGSTSPFSGRTMPKDQMEMNVQVGLSKREMFAMAAMQGRIASFAQAQDRPNPDKVAEFACQCADALLEKLKT